MALEHFVNNVQKLSAECHWQQLADFCRRSIGDILQKNMQHLDNVLQTFNLQQHTLGVLSILYTKLVHGGNRADFETLFVLVNDFVCNCSGEQMRYMADIFGEVCHRVTDTLVVMDQPARGITLMQRAIEKVQVSSICLTSVHADLCQLCLAAKILRPALPMLDVDIREIPREGGNVFEAKAFLCFYYYGGMIYTALKKFDRALYFFEVALTTSSSAVSHIMVEAHKKFVLVSLLHAGKVLPLPKYASNVVARFIKPLCLPYNDLAQAYATSKPEKLQEMASKHQAVFLNDRNLGLVKQVVQSLYKRNIQRLTKTFLTLSLADVANRCQLRDVAEAERYILNMIDDGEIFASISQKDGMVSFQDHPQKYEDPSMMQQIDNHLTTCIAQEKFLVAMDRRILLNPEYVRKASKASTSYHDDEGVGLAGSLGSTIPFDAP